MTPQKVPRTKGVTTRDLFLFLSQKLRAMVRRDGYDLKTFVNLALPYFSELTSDGQEKAVWHIHSLIEICKEMEAHSLRYQDSRVLVPAFFDYAAVQAPPDLIDTLMADDLVDIYNDKEQLVFASFPFLFGPGAYSLEEVFCRSWTELYGRATPYLSERYFSLAQELLAGRHRGLVNTAEISNAEGLQLAKRNGLESLLIQQVMAPVFDFGGQVAGYLCINRLETLNQPG